MDPGFLQEVRTVRIDRRISDRRTIEILQFDTAVAVVDESEYDEANGNERDQVSNQPKTTGP